MIEKPANLLLGFIDNVLIDHAQDSPRQHCVECRIVSA